MEINPQLTQIDDCLYRLAVRALLFYEGKVLLVREKDADWWSFPGGGIDYGEDAADALARELAEELAIAPADMPAAMPLVHIATRSVVHGVPRANLFYRLDIPPAAIHAGSDVTEIRWFNPEELTSEITDRYVGTAAGEAEAFVAAILSTATKTQ